MTPLNAVVKAGRLTLNEPTDLPDGQVVVLLPLEELLQMEDMFEVVSVPPSREFKKSKVIDAKALIDEIRSY